MLLLYRVLKWPDDLLQLTCHSSSSFLFRLSSCPLSHVPLGHHLGLLPKYSLSRTLIFLLFIHWGHTGLTTPYRFHVNTWSTLNLSLFHNHLVIYLLPFSYGPSLIDSLYCLPVIAFSCHWIQKTGSGWKLDSVVFSFIWSFSLPSLFALWHKGPPIHLSFQIKLCLVPFHQRESSHWLPK